MRPAVLTGALVFCALALAACGKKGPPEPPGPPDQITYPRGYPAAPTTPPRTVSPEAVWPWPRL